MLKVKKEDSDKAEQIYRLIKLFAVQTSPAIIFYTPPPNLNVYLLPDMLIDQDVSIHRDNFVL